MSVLAIDAGTTGVTALVVTADGSVAGRGYAEFSQYFPQPGWVEQRPEEIWQATLSACTGALAAVGDEADPVTCAGITNQRETAVIWDAATLTSPHRAIVWQDRRTAARCDALRAAGHEPLVRERTGLVLDPYFSSTKLEWLLTDGGVVADGALAFGTVDSWLLWRLTGGADGGVHATDPSNASRTMLFDIDALDWSAELLDLFGVPASSLPTVMPSSGVFGTTAPSCAAGLRVPVAGIAGDQQAALLGQACFEPGMTKNTYGTGSFVLVNLGAGHPPPSDGLLTSVGWTAAGATTYVMEGSVFVTGAAVQWLRDGLGIIDDAAEVGPLAASVPDTGGVVFVPAFTGLGSPWWDPYARGTIIGITRGTTRAHVARAVVESMAWQTRDVVDAIVDACGRPVAELRADGGASVMDVLCQFQADVLGVTVRRPQVQQTTALGAAYLAGLATGVWATPADAASNWIAEAEFVPSMPAGDVASGHARWRRAVERSRGWALD
jgi:glycerol kinase